MPQLSDLRESGAIEQDADMVMFIYRPEYYDIQSNEQGESVQGETLIKIAKHRNGSLETIKLQARLDIQKFEDAGYGGSSWRKVPSVRPDDTGKGGGNAQLYIDKGSKMNDDSFNDDLNDDFGNAPF
jgi:replicative DNA helicase